MNELDIDWYGLAVKVFKINMLVNQRNILKSSKNNNGFCIIVVLSMNKFVMLLNQ